MSSTWTTRHPSTAAIGIEMHEIKLSYVTRYRDRRDGKMRYQFRRKGFKRIMLRGKVGSAEFMAQSEKPIAHVGASRTKPGTIDALVVNTWITLPSRAWPIRRRQRGVAFSITSATSRRQAADATAMPGSRP